MNSEDYQQGESTGGWELTKAVVEEAVLKSSVARDFHRYLLDPYVGVPVERRDAFMCKCDGYRNLFS